ncbi:MAG: NnrU family protein [Rubritepida sp.]|jgi:uncharacterized membrane protein|nr:NnrU family protein [Rubritepida sp.]
MLDMTLLALAAALWVGVHFGIAGTVVRARIVARTGENAFRIGYSLLSVGAIVLLVQAWNAAPYVELWLAPDWLRWLVALLMLPAFVLFVASVATPNPTAVAGKLAAEGPTGIQRITRHPMLWSFALWAGLHLLAKGTLGGVFFFGAFLVTALAGMPSIDRKITARDPEMAARLLGSTSILPFQAILSGRNRLALDEIPRFVWIVAGVAWLGLLVAHPWIFGYPALPF